MSRPLDKSFDLSSTLTRIVVESLRVVDADRCALLLRHPEKDAFRVEASVGFSQGYLDAVSRKWKDLPLGRLLREPRLFYSRDARADPLFQAVRPEIEAEGFRSILIVPLVSGGAVLGGLGLYFNEVRELSAEEESLVQTFAITAAIAVESARAFEELRVRSKRQEALRKVTRDITEDLDLTALFSRICKSVCDLLHLEFSHLFILDEKSSVFRLAGEFGKRLEGESEYAVFPQGKGLLSRVVAQRKPVVVADVMEDPDWVGHAWARNAGVRSFLGIPFLWQDRVVGVLSSFSRRLREFRPEEIELVRDFADQAVVALKNARAFEQVNRKSAQISRLVEINRKLTSAVELDEILDSILEASKDLVGGRYAVVCLHDEAKERIVPHAKSLGRFAHGVDFPILKVGEGLAGWVAKTREPLIVPEAQKDPRWVVALWNHDLVLGAFAGLPLISRGKLLGVLGLYADQGQGLSEEGFEVLMSFADQAAVAIDKARLFSEAQRRATTLEVLDEIAKAIDSALDMDELFRITVEQVKRVIPCNRSSLYRVDADKAVAFPALFVDDVEERGHGFHVKVDLPGTYFERVLQTLEPVYRPDTRKDPDPRAQSLAAEGLLSIVNVPIVSEGEGKCIGLLNVGSVQVNAFTREHIELLQSVADHLVLAMKNAELYAETQRRATNLEVLDEIAKAVNSTLELDALFKIAVEQVRRLVPCEGITLYAIDERRKLIRDFWITDDKKKRESWIAHRRDLTGSQYERIFETREPLYTPDARESPYERIRSLAAEGLLSIVNVPVRSEGGCIGALNVVSEEADAYSREDIGLLVSVADHLATAMKNAELYAEAQKRATNLEVLDRIAKAINSTLDLTQLFHVSVEQVKRVVPCSRCSLYNLNAEKTAISDYCLDEEMEERGRWIEARRALAGSQFEEVLRTKEPLYTPDTAKSPYDRLRSVAGLNLRSTLSVPIVIEGECVGFLNVASPEVNAFTEDHIQMLRSVASHLAIAIRNAALYGQIREAGERLDNFVRSATDGIITADLEGRITSWNPAAEVIYGYPEKEVLGQPFYRVFPDDAEEVREVRRRVMAGEPVPTVETVRRRKDGAPVEVSLMLSRIVDAKGRPVGVSGIQRDIGAQKRAEEALRKSEEKYRTLFERASDAIEIVDEGGQLIDCNRHMCELMGYTREELLGMRLRDIVAPEYKETLPLRVARLLEGKILTPYDSANLTKDGSRVDVEVSAGFIEVEGRKRIIFFLRDITERKRAQAMLLRSEKLAALGRMTAGTAHEILNPANIIGLHAQVLAEEADHPAVVRKSAEAICRSVERIAKICRSLRRFSRGGRPSVTRFDVGDLLRESVSLAEPQSRLEDVTFAIDVSAEALPLEADRDQILQVLLNLISNARDAMPKGGRITLSAEGFPHREGPWVRIAVRDEGAGIPPEHLGRIFDPFFTTKDEDKGTGLGLSIAHGIVEDHGGRIDVQSQAGTGTVFRIELPARPSGNPKTREEAQPLEVSGHFRPPRG
ncbi:MAG: GAF domain-containing protein [Candidatus Tectomicrobia bacterium]|nr:GAF domain-containing protein [Candidatus Tectomicrobia bacterium]